MGKEINIDEILTRSHKQAGDKKPKEAKIIDSETGEEMEAAPNKKSKAGAQGDAGFGSFGGPQGMPGNFSEVFNNPEVMKMFSGGAIPGFKGLPLKQRIMFKLMGFFAKPGRRNLLRKRWWPVWAIFIILLLGLFIVAALIYGIYRLAKALVMPYINIFKGKS